MTDGPSVEPTGLAALWRASGAQWLTDPGVGVPVRLAQSILDLVSELDRRGAGLAHAVGAGGLGLLGERAALLALGRSGSVSAGGATRLVQCADAWIALSLARPDDLDALPALLGLAGPIGPDADPWAIVEDIAARTCAATLVDQAQLLGLACAIVGGASGSGVTRRLMGDASPAPLASLTVANLASLWAGPLAADVLARLGARVITVESTGRPDGSRARPEFFETLHGCSESVAIAFDTELGRRRLRELLERVDVVIEGSRPRALEQIGIEAASLVAAGPRIWLSITAHGRDAPHADLIGYGDDAAAAGGLVGWVGAEPRFIADAVADPLAGLTAASQVASLVDEGGRWMVDVALARVAASLAARSPDDWVRPLADPMPPRRRLGARHPMPLGRDTDRVLAAMGIA